MILTVAPCVSKAVVPPLVPKAPSRPVPRRAPPAHAPDPHKGEAAVILFLVLLCLLWAAFNR